MKVHLREVRGGEERIFTTMSGRLMSYFQHYANKMGIWDREVDRFDYTSAWRALYHPNHHIYFIIGDGEIVGMVQTITKDVYVFPGDFPVNTVKIKKLFVTKEFRRKGIATQVIKILMSQGLPVEVECPYELPANKLFQKMGFRTRKTFYYMPN